MIRIEMSVTDTEKHTTRADDDTDNQNSKLFLVIIADKARYTKKMDLLN